MGIFSSKYVTQVGTSVSRVIDDASIPDSTNAGLLKSLFNEGDLVEHMLDELSVSIGQRADRMYAYAEEHYPHGLPSGEIYSSTQGRQQVEAVIEAAEGQQVLMKYSHYGPPNTLHIGWLKLVNQYGYNESTNQLGALTLVKGSPVYLKDMVVVVPESQIDSIENGALAQWGSSASSGYTPERLNSIGPLIKVADASPIYKSATATELHLLVTYVWQTQTPVNPVLYNTVINEETFTLSVSEYDTAADFFHAKYTLTSNGQTKYWIYQNKTGTHPSLDAVYVDGPAVSGSYFPFTYFRYNKQSVISDTTTDEYKASKRMMDILGLDYDLVAGGIDENPDIADVEQAMLVFGVPAVSSDPIECRYLFEYFDTLHYDMQGSASGSSALNRISALLANDPATLNTIIIKDAQFKMSLQNSGIYKRIVAGNLGAGIEHTSSFMMVDVETQYVDVETGATTSVIKRVPEHKYCRQIAPGFYEEILVRDLRMTYFIFEEYTTTADETDLILLIPIDRTITDSYSVKDRERLYSRSLHFVFNSRVVTKLSWYQTGVFQVILIIVAIVITIYTYGADGGSSIATALGLSGTQGLIATIVFNLIVSQLTAAALAGVYRFAVKALGQEVATALAIIAIVLGAYKFMTMEGLAGAPFAADMLTLANGLQQAVLSDKMVDLLTEADQFKIFVDEATKTLEASNELLENSVQLSPFIVFGEKPEDFYNRTVHSGNIGILGINAISYYVDVALTLPKLKDTLGEETYAT